MSSDDEDIGSSHLTPEEPSPIEDADENTIRIMLSTDNHLGYAEGDAVRGNDSFAALEEVLYLAKHYRCDMVLLSGDLFHENKPSRRTMYRAMQLFRKYCMGPDPISIQILSDQATNFRQGQVNYQNEFYSVDLPVMSIHGNHDDPSREGTELFAALDLLDCSGLVNYIGRQEQINQIEIAPVLMKKGTTHLALYGLGSMRDERLNRMWQGSKLTFLRPNQDENVNATEFFNLFTLHQNRDKGRGTKNCVHESMIPEWMDLVCWGHEHECNIEPQESVVGTFRITQPGSSVATSLVAGEAVTKQVGILDIRDQAFRLRAIPLTQVRTFVLGDISLQNNRSLDPDDPMIEEKIKRLLKENVELLIHQAKEKQREIRENAAQNWNSLANMDESPLSMTMEKPDEGLVRLKVEHSGFTALNNQRFGAQFIGQVANPTDILLFQRKRNTGQRNVKVMKKMAPIEPDQLEEMNIEDLIVGELEQPERKLELFDEKRIAHALEDYVQKQQAQALNDVVKGLLGRQQKRLLSTHQSSTNDDTNPDADDPGDERRDTVKSRKPSRSSRTTDDDPDDSTPRNTNRAQAKKSRHVGSKRKGRGASLELAGSDDEVQHKPIAGRKKKAIDLSSPASEDDDMSVSDDIPEVNLEKKSRATRGKQASYVMSDDSFEEDAVSSPEMAPRTKGRGRKRTATPATKTKSPPSPLSQQKSLNQSQLSFAPVQRKRRNTAKAGASYASDNSDDDWGSARR